MTFFQIYILSILLLSVSAFGLQGVFSSGLKKTGLKPALISFFILFGIFTSLHAVIFVLTQRTVLSTGACLVLVLVVGGVSNAKYAALKEPLVFTDFYLYLQAFKHPRLYFPFLKVVPTIGVIVAALCILGAGFYFEKASLQWVSWISVYLLLLAYSMLFLVFQLARKVNISENIMHDCQQYGVLCCLVLYTAHSSKNHQKLQKRILLESPFSKRIAPKSNQLGSVDDLVVIQSESFFDARLLSSNIKQDVLSDYDELLIQCLSYGRLRVPAWGANTMRTEFAFLTGLNPEVLGLSQYYPYQQLQRYRLPSLLSDLKDKGYFCICIHPHASDFFMRDTFFNKLGFDQFIDETEFLSAQREGPYIADEAITQKIKETLGRQEQPCFIFAITMENHGPLHLEQVMQQEWCEYFHEKPKLDSDELVAYLRHLKNANRMVLELKHYLGVRSRESILAFYGDHVPAISNVFNMYDYDDPRSNYCVWSSRANNQKMMLVENEIELTAEGLAPLLARVISNS